jgi:ABC-type multidrug transport system ATPase subunit
MDTSSPALEAVGLSLRTRGGVVYENVTLSVPAGAFAMLVGPTGSGKTALLLTLAGRMKPTRGLLRSFGEDGLRSGSAVRRRTSLALVGGVNDLSDTLSVGDHVREALALHGERATPARIATALDAAGLTCDPSRKAGRLSAIERELLGVALALVYRPRVLIVDDADHDLTPDEQDRLMGALRSIADAGVTVIAACVDPRLAASGAVTLAVTIDPMKEGEVDEVA